MMIRYIVLCVLMLFPFIGNADELPDPYFGISGGGHYCETEQQMLDFMGLLDLVERGELEPFSGFPTGCGVIAVGIPLYYEPMRWVEYQSASVLLGRITTRENLVYYVYLGVKIHPGI